MTGICSKYLFKVFSFLFFFFFFLKKGLDLILYFERVYIPQFIELSKKGGMTVFLLSFKKYLL